MGTTKALLNMIVSAILSIIAISYFWNLLTKESYAISVVTIFLAGILFGLSLMALMRGGKNE